MGQSATSLIERSIALWYALALALLVAIAALQYRTTARLVAAGRWVAHSDEVLTEIQAVYAGVAEAESLVRGYVITGDESFLTPYRTIVFQSTEHLRRLRHLTADNARQQRRLDTLEPLIGERLDHLARILELRSGPESVQASQFVAGGVGLGLMNHVREVLGEMETEEHNVLRRRRTVTEAGTGQANAVILLATFLSIGLLILAASMVHRDLIIRKRAEKALRESEQRFRSLAAGVKDVRDYAILTLDADGRITSWNEGAERIKGYKGEEIIGQHFSCFYPQEDRERAKPETVLQAAAAEGRFEDEGWRVRKDGSCFWANTIITALKDQAGNLRGFSKVTRDFTERKQLEQTLEQNNLQLERANLAKDNFLANMSHELRTPLNAVIGFTGTLLMRLPGPLTNEQDRQLQTVRQSAKHLLSLISDLLDLAKIGAGKFTVTPEPVVLQNVVEEVYGTLCPLAEQKCLKLSTTVPRGELVIETDRRTVNQILLNLASNAIKFTDRGEVRIALSHESNNGENGSPWMQFRVEDTGIGIRPEDQASVFQDFTQLGIQSERHQGTGLGLHLSRKLAEMIGGRISFVSEYGKGTTFTLSLPQNMNG